MIRKGVGQVEPCLVKPIIFFTPQAMGFAKGSTHPAPLLQFQHDGQISFE
jgi:hypothetical protein